MPTNLSYGMVDRYRSPFPKLISDSRHHIMELATDVIMDSSKSIKEQCLAWIAEVFILGPNNMDMNYSWQEMYDYMKDALVKRGNGCISCLARLNELYSYTKDYSHIDPSINEEIQQVLEATRQHIEEHNA